MKHISHLTSIVLILMTVSPKTKAQQQGPCVSNMLKYIDRTAQGNIRPEKGQAFFMHYTSENVPHEKFRSNVIKNEFKIYITPTQTILESDDISVYRDEVDLFAVVHPLKKVIWGAAGAAPEMTNSGIQQLAGMQKEILTTGEVTKCETIGSGENKFQKVELIPAKPYRDRYHITSMVILFDPHQDMISKVVISFEEDQDVVTQIVTYKEVNFDYRGFKPVMVKKQFLDKNGKLNKKYPGYTLVKN